MRRWALLWPFLALALLSLIHTISITLFAKGFLLSRGEISDRASPSNAVPSFGRHNRAIVLVIDALRSDFLIPEPSSSIADYYIHNRLTTPKRISEESPEQSVSFKFIADPPTTTLQRLKGLTGGSLPTFFDAAENFSPGAQGEDSWLEQAASAGKKIAFVGDDTWTSLFPVDGKIMSQNMTWPADSFDVHDLDTVDSIVERRISELLHISPSSSTASSRSSSTSDFDILIAHNLGLDHSGHRYGPSHPETSRKLDENDRLIAKIVESLRDDDLFIVFGDHGMDAKGDHGGDSVLELNAALWMYSKQGLFPKSLPLFNDSNHPLASILSDPVIASRSLPVEAGYDSDSVNIEQEHSVRPIPQVSIVPTLSLLLGIPIPFSNLGCIIPELFLYTPGQAKSTDWNYDTLNKASIANAMQIETYLRKMIADDTVASFQEFAPHVEELISQRYTSRTDASSTAVANDNIVQAHKSLAFMHKTLSCARQLWTTFDLVYMIIGMIGMTSSIITILTLFWMANEEGSLDNEDNRKGSITVAIRRAYKFAPISMCIVWMALLVSKYFEIEFLDWSGILMSTLVVSSQFGLLTSKGTRSSLSKFFQNISNEISSSVTLDSMLAASMLIVHSLVPASNSFIVDESFVIHNLSAVVIMISFIRAFSYPEAKLKKHVLYAFGVFLICIRLLRWFILCREEQRGYCLTTFYKSSLSNGSSAAPRWVLILALPVAMAVPWIFSGVLTLSGSKQGAAGFWINGLFHSLLVLGSLYWIAVEAEALEIFADLGQVLLKYAQTWTGRFAIIGVWLVGLVLWPNVPLPLSIEKQEQSLESSGSSKPVVVVKGFANVMGTHYMLFWTCAVVLTWTSSLLTGQIALAIGLTAIMALTEAYDAEADSQEIIEKFIRSSSNARNSNKNNDEDDEYITKKNNNSSDRRPRAKYVFLLVLLGYQLFFAMGHQAVISSIQWKSAFVGNLGGSAGQDSSRRSVNFVTAGLVLVNALGPNVLISALWAPAMALWKISPGLRLPSNSQMAETKANSSSSNNGENTDATRKEYLGSVRHIFSTSLLYILYQTIITTSSLICSTHLRRHLMFWKIYAPRTMLSAMILVATDWILAIVGIAFATGIVLRRTQNAFGTKWR